MTERQSSPRMVRNLDAELLHQVRIEALKRRMSTGELLNEIIRAWLARQQG